MGNTARNNQECTNKEWKMQQEIIGNAARINGKCSKK